MEKLKVGILKEVKAGEGRVILTPEEVKKLYSIFSNIEIYVSKGAGEQAGYYDSNYSDQAHIVDNNFIWENCDLVLKVKEPLPEEIKKAKFGQRIVAFIHTPALDYLKPAIEEKKLQIFALERWERDGVDPLSEMSKIAGEVGANLGIMALETKLIYNSKRFSYVFSDKKANAMIIGSAGQVGRVATEVLAKQDIFNKIVCVDPQNHSFSKYIDGRPLIINTKQFSLDSLADADLIICGARVPGQSAPKILAAKEVEFLKDGVVIVDVAIDEGGNFEYSYPQKPNESPRIVMVRGKEIVLISIPNLPGTVPRVSTPAISRAVFPFVKSIIETFQSNESFPEDVIKTLII